MNINNISSLKLNNNFAIKHHNQNINATLNNAKDNNFNFTTYPKSYYLNQISFTSKRSSANMLAERIGESNFPSPEIVKRLRKIGKSSDFSLYGIHIDYYKDLLDCSTLDEAKEKYPEFAGVIDAKDIDINSLDKKSTLYKIANSEIKDININTLTLDLLKRYYAKLKAIYDKKEYWEITPSAVLKIMRTLNIVSLSKGYNTAIRTTEETRKKHSQSSAKNWQNPEYKKQVSQSAKEAHKNPNSKYNSDGYRMKCSKSAKEAHKNPNSKFNSDGYRNKRSQIAEELWQTPEYLEKQVKSRSSDEYKAKHSQSAKEAHKNPNSKFNSDGYRNKRSQIAEELWQTPEYLEKQVKSRSSDEYKAKRALISNAKREAFKRHPEIIDMMSKVAKDFPQIGAIIKKQRRNEKLSQQEKNYRLRYFKECEALIPGYMKIIGDEQHKILVEWGIMEE